MGLLNVYSTRQDVLDELSTYSPILNLTDNEYELELFQTYLYTDKLKVMEMSVNSCTNLDDYDKMKSKYEFIANLIQAKGKYIDILCQVFVSLNNYILSHSQFYIKPINDFATKTGLGTQCINVGAVNLCGGWVVVEFVQGQ